MKWLSGILLALFLFAPAIASAQKAVTIGNTPVVLPALEGLHELYGQNKTFDAMVEQFVPPNYRLLAVYVADADVAAMNANPQAGIKRYILVQTAASDVTIRNASDFNAVKEEIANQIGSGDWQNDSAVIDTIDQAADYMHTNFNIDADLKIGETNVIGKIVDSDTAFSVLMLTNFGVTTEKGTQSHPIAIALSAIAVKSKILYASVYSDYHGGPDIDFVTQSAKKLIAGAFEANTVRQAAAPEPEPQPSPPRPQLEPPAGLVPSDMQDITAPPVIAEPGEKKDKGEEEKPEVDAHVGDAMAWATKVAFLILVISGAALLLPRIIRRLRNKDESL